MRGAWSWVAGGAGSHAGWAWLTGSHAEQRGWTLHGPAAFEAAAACGCEEAIKALLPAKADVHAKDNVRVGGG
jgi:hypothetical protein